MTQLSIETHSAEATRALGACIGENLPKGVWINLVGDLGAGKTQLVKGIAEGMGVARANEVRSPTFTLVRAYGAPERTLVHADLYRLSSDDPTIQEEIAELSRDDAVVVVEWAERCEAALPESIITIRLEHLGGDQRLISTETPDDSPIWIRCFKASRAANDDQATS